VKAFDLIMADVASQKPDRRRCARRVLHDALRFDHVGQKGAHSWMVTVLELKHSKALVREAVKHMVRLSRPM
jgi:hypothetical protein